MLLLNRCISLCPGDESHPPVAPLPPPHAPHLGHPHGHLHVHAVPDVDEGGGMGGDLGPDRGRGGVPDLTLGVEEGTDPRDPGGDETGRDHALTIETGSERGTETGTGDDTLHADEQGKTQRCLSTVVGLHRKEQQLKLSFCFPSGPAPAHGRGAARDEGVAVAEATGGETATATATVPLGPPAALTTVPPLLTEESSPLPPPSVTS